MNIGAVSASDVVWTLIDNLGLGRILINRSKGKAFGIMEIDARILYPARTYRRIRLELPVLSLQTCAGDRSRVRL